MTLTPQIKEAALIEYLDECAEMLDRFAKSMARIEQGENSGEFLAAIYRDMHTIKGSSQLFGFHQIGAVSHAMETCLDPIRKGQAKVTPELVDGLYSGCDIVNKLLAGIRLERREPDLKAEINLLIPKLVEIAEQGVANHIALAPDKALTEEALPQKPKQKAEENLGFGFFDDEPAIKPTVKPEQRTATPVPKLEQAPPASPKPAADDAQAETIRVHVSLLDNLMNLVGEQVLIRNQLLQHAKINDSDSDLAKLGQRLNVLTGELQNEVMKTRMQPVGNVLGKFTRVVRDMGRELGKKIEVNIVGAETELDKTIIEAIKDPLTHIIRNSVDHGIESPTERKNAGKPETGQLAVKAHHESGQVIIEISDDGRGLDPKRIGAKAVEKGLVTSEGLARLNDKEVQSLIFAPGFSTAAAVSNISGRGVGMDVVKTNIERIGGLVDLHSIPGTGTNIKFKIPLTLAIVPALIVRALGQRFAIPQAKLVELVLIDEANPSAERIETLQGSLVLRLRGKILPLLRLSDVLSESPAAQKLAATTNIVILNADGFQFGLIVDEIDDTADIVVKALAPFLKEIAQFSGATVMGDGSVALTIDVMGISETARLRQGADAATTSSEIGARKQGLHQTDVAEFLLVDVGAPSYYALPLAVVARLEEFSAEDFDLSGEQKVVRYRDTLLPVFSLPDFLHLPFTQERLSNDKVSVVVIRRGDNLFGIEVFAIRDVVSLPSRIDQTVRDRPGILGTMIAGDEVLVVVDVLGMIDAVKGKLSAAAGDTQSTRGADGKTNAVRRQSRILFAEDSAFFRGYIRQVLEEAGFTVEAVADGAEAWSVLESSAAGRFTVLLSDIEMPILDGFELATKVSSDARFKALPLIAITTRYSNADVERGRQAGFTRYLEKLNAEKLLSVLDEVTSAKELKRAAS